MSLSFRNYSEFSKWIKYHFPEFENKDGIFEQLFHILAKRDTNHEVYEQMGDIYLELTGSKQKSDWGQFYTPKSIIHLMIGLLSITKEDRILDPSCGSGYFLYNVFNFLLKEEQTLKSSEFHDHNRLDFIYSSLGNMRGIDIQEVPVYLARISILSLLIENNPKSGELPLDTIISTLHEKIHTKDFFSLKLSDDEQEKYDIIIGNPPYVRQRNIKNKKKVRSHLNPELFRSHANHKDYRQVIDKRSDLFVYFITKAYHHLKNNGKLAFIIPDKWMTTKYGVGMQEFLLDNFFIKKIILFEKNVFDGILVPSSILILEKNQHILNEKNHNQENEYLLKQNSVQVQFILLKSNFSKEKLLSKANSKSNYSSPSIEICHVPQSRLRKIKKWFKFVYAPSIYWDILKNTHMLPIQDLFKIKYRIKTGCDDFFYLSDSDVLLFNISDQFLKPIAKSISQTDTIYFSKKFTKTSVLDLYSYIEEIGQINNSKSVAEKKKPSKLKEKILSQYKSLKNHLNHETRDFYHKHRSPIEMKDLNALNINELLVLSHLYSDQHFGLFYYLMYSMFGKQDWGRFGPPHLRSTCISHRKSKLCWFNLGKLTSPDIMVPETVDQRVFSCINGDHLIADVDLIDLYLRSPPSEKIKNKNNKITKQEMLSLTLGFLNSKIFHIFRELEGRISGGGASRLKIFELKKIKILNPYTMEKNPRNEVISLTKRLVNKPMNSKEYFSIQKDLDQEILKAIGMEGRYEELQKSVDDLLSRRKK